MRFKFLAGSLPVLLLSVSAWRFSHSAPSAVPEPPVVSLPAAATRLSGTVASGYTSFAIERTFVLPAGPKGLEYTREAADLSGRPVRISGYMVRHAHEDPAIFLLTAQPMVLNMQEYGLADDLPANAVHVILPVIPGKAPDWIRLPITVYGTLELGPRQELDGRISHVRVLADHVTAADGFTLLEPRRSVALQPARIRSGKLRAPSLPVSTDNTIPTTIQK